MFSKKIVGLDISDQTIEMMCLSGLALHTRVLGISRTNLEPGIVERGRIKDVEKLAKILKQLFKTAKPKSIIPHNVVFGLPDDITYIHVFTLEPHNKKQRDNLIMEEVETNIPDDFEDLVYSYRVLHKDKEGVEVLLTAINKKLLYEWKSFFKKNKIEIQTFDIEALATFRDLYSSPPKEPVCVVDFGAEITKINIFDQDGLHLNYSVDIAGSNINEVIAKNIKTKKVDVEKEKIKQGLTGKNKKIVDAISKQVDAMLGEVINAQKYFKNQTRLEVKEVVLVGESSKLKGLVEYAGEKLQMKVEIGKSRVLKKKILLEYVEAAGLALRGLNKNWDKKDPSIEWKGTIKKQESITATAGFHFCRGRNKKQKILDIGQENDQNNSGETRSMTKFLSIILLVAIVVLAGVFGYKQYLKKEMRQDLQSKASLNRI